MAISVRDIAGYLQRYPQEAALLSELVRLLSQGGDFASRRSFLVHVTASALLVRGSEILLAGHRAYGIVLQPGGHLEPGDATLAGAAERELAEDRYPPGHGEPRLPGPVYVEYVRVRARPEKDEPEHLHLDFGYAFTTAGGDAGRIQESEVTGARWYPLAEAGRLLGPRIGRAVSAQRG